MKTTSRAVAAALVAVFAVVLVRTAWVSDDAFITLRVVDNAVNGFGLRWNVAERVQAYTHPLWMLVLLPSYAITREPFFTTLTLAAVISLAAFGWIAWGRRDDPWTAVAVLVPLIVSRAFVDYSTAGLENPLTHLLLVAFVAGLDGAVDRRRFVRLCAIAALLALNRLDALLLVGPTLAWTAWRRGPRAAWREGLFGFLPLIAWTLFSIAYYGLAYPNTALAKLATGIPAGELAAQGLRYLGESIRNDPSTLAATAAGCAAAVLLGGARERLLAAGAALYLAYTVKVGGDFMAGRFLAAPLLLALLAGVPVARSPRWARAALAAGALALSFAGPFPNLATPASYATDRTALVDPSGIADERRYYFSFQGWRSGARDPRRPLPTATREGRELRRSGATLDVAWAVGVRGYYAGPRTHIIDGNALTDPLLARLPMVERDHGFAAFRRRHGFPEPHPAWRVGHFARQVPQGYLATLISGENRIADPEIAAAWNDVAVVTRGGLWGSGRWRVILGWLAGGGRLDRPRGEWIAIPWGEALALRPADPVFLRGRAATLLSMGDLGRATADLDVALAADPQDLEARMLAAQVRASSGDLAAAAAGAKRAVEIAPDDPEIRSMYAALLAAQGDPRSAVEEFRRALDGDPVFAAAARAGLGRCLLALGDAGNAERWLREAAASDPSNGDWRRLLEQARRGGR